MGYMVDINCDVGEGVDNETQLMPLISSCNISCGAHAGDPETMRNVIRLAKTHGVKIGAHPSYPDRTNFGRSVMEITDGELVKSLKEQLKTFVGILTGEKASMHHVKPHGALYNQIAKDSGLANVFLQAMQDYRLVPIYVPYGSKIAEEAKKQGFKTIHEAFADRNYTSNLQLVPRTAPNALIEEPKAVLDHVITMVKRKKVRTLDGHDIDIQAETFCVHGDTPSALKILMYIQQQLPKQLT